MGDAQILLCRRDDVVPQSCLEVRFEFGEVIVRARPGIGQDVGIVEQIQSKVHDGSRCDRPIDGNMSFVEMPSTGTNKQDGRLLGFEFVHLAVRSRVHNGLVDGITQVTLSFHNVGKGRTGAVFKVCHVHVGTAVETVDDHFSIDGSGDFDATVSNVCRNGSASPRRIIRGRRRRQELRNKATVKGLGTALSCLQQILSTTFELGTEQSDQTKGVGSQDFGRRLGRRCMDLNEEIFRTKFHLELFVSFF
mmetsp:Transcript_3303/g.6006  ORF Transcript_3303/g.6006 Transcript_3303/m.6006 type:complete len:249 (+) Transcript_3303:405-1151(+)